MTKEVIIDGIVYVPKNELERKITVNGVAVSFNLTLEQETIYVAEKDFLGTIKKAHQNDIFKQPKLYPNYDEPGMPIYSSFTIPSNIGGGSGSTRLASFSGGS